MDMSKSTWIDDSSFLNKPVVPFYAKCREYNKRTRTK